MKSVWCDILKGEALSVDRPIEERAFPVLKTYMFSSTGVKSLKGWVENSIPFFIELKRFNLTELKFE